ncbi:hypothetical protein H4R19_001124 [Coemansia spiralis]|nr:hypothetical protein H4R19_001124 [Coemansia spiralis]
MANGTLDLQPDPARLNPRFDGYKLRLIDSNDRTAVRTHPLQSAPAQPQLLASNELFTYDEVCSRIHYNHLFPGPQQGTFIYFSGGTRAVLVDTRGEGALRFAPLFDVPPRPSTGALQGYPGAYALSNTVVLVFDGAESLYVLRHPGADDAQWLPVGMFGLGNGPIAAGPAGGARRRPTMNYVLGATLGRAKGAELSIRLHYCHRIDKETPPATRERPGHSAPTFCVQALQVDVPSDAIATDSRPAGIPELATSTAHTLHTHAIPVYCAYASWDRYILGVRGGVVLDDTELVLQPPEGVAAAASSIGPSRYCWAQTSSDVTVYFELPLALKANQIQCEMARATLSLHFADADPQLAEFVRDRAPLHDRIVADESVWTLESGRLLTLHLQKEHEGARWTSVFGADDGVLETMDPSELAAIRGRLEKYTAAAQEPGRSTIPLMQPYVDQDSGGDLEQLEEEPDASVMFSVRDWPLGRAEATSTPGSPGWLCAAFPRGPAAPQGPEPVCLRFDVDGVVFGFGAAASGGSSQQHLHPVEARHTGTFSALSYVQASKREKRFLGFDPDLTVAVLAEAQRRVYIYHQVPRADAADSVQNVVDLGGSGADAEILGVQLAGRVLAVLRARSLCTIDLRTC